MKNKDLLNNILLSYEDRFELIKPKTKGTHLSFNVKALKKDCPACNVVMYWKNAAKGDIQYCDNCYYEIEIVGMNPLELDLTPEWKKFAYMY